MVNLYCLKAACPVTVRSYHACVVNLSSLRFEFHSRQRYVIACSSPSLLISSAHHHLLSARAVSLKFKHAHLKFPVSGRSKRTSIDTPMRAQCSHASVGLTQAHPKPHDCLSYANSKNVVLVKHFVRG